MSDSTLQIVLLLTNSLLPLSVGYFLHRAKLITREGTQRIIKINVRFVFTVLAFISFWRLQIRASFVWVPIIGLIITFVPYFIMAFVSRNNPDPLERGALVTAGMLGNTGTLGGLVSYLLLGPAAYALVQIIAVIQNVILILFNFPVAQKFKEMENKGITTTPQKRSFFSLFFTWNQISMIGMISGTYLSVTGVTQPEWMDDLFRPLIMMSAWCGFVPVGLMLEFKSVKQYFAKTGFMFPLKFLIMPVMTWACCYILPLTHLETVTLIILSMCPTAINSVITCALYGLKTEIAVSSFVTTTLFFLVLICPILFITIT